MEYIASLSYGKDSMAMIHVIRDVLDLPLDRIITADIWATATIPADLPPMVEFKEYADREIKKRYGIDVEHFCAKKVSGTHGDKVTFEDVFYHRTTKGKYVGEIKGFPKNFHSWCVQLKTSALYQCNKGQIEYIGIAYDEPERIARHIKNEQVKMPLVEAEWTEQMCYEWCRKNGLLSPIYTDSARGGCWFCGKQPIDQLRILRKKYPELWKLLLKWDLDSKVAFKSNGCTVHKLEKRFRWEDEGYKPMQKQFRWADVENSQMNVFQIIGEETMDSDDPEKQTNGVTEEDAE